MMSRTSRMLKWIGAGTVLLAAAPIAWAEPPGRPHPVVHSATNKQVSEPQHPAFHRTCASCHLTVPHSNQAQ